MPATKCIHHLVYDPVDEQGWSRAHCLKCDYSKVVPVTFEAVLKSLKKDNILQHGYNIYTKEIMERNQREGVAASRSPRPHHCDGVFRPVDETVNKIDFTHVDLNNKVPLLLPFNIHQYVEFYHKNLVLVSGEVNSGKTCFLYNVAILNYPHIPVDFYTNNEASPEEIVKRLMPFGIPVDPPPFDIYERYDNFADVLKPGHISIIDYLDLNSEVYLAGDEIERIHQRNDVVAVIGMQLPPPAVTYEKGRKKLHHRNLAYGGAFTSKKPVLYINLWNDGAANTGICHIEKAKNRAIPTINPNHMQWKYVIDEWGAKYKKWEQYHENNYTEQDFEQEGY